MILILKAISDETRLKILKFLLNGERCVCEIFPHVKRTQSTTSLQLKKLENAGLIKSRREGKKIIYSTKDKRVINLIKALNEGGRK